MKGFIMLLMRCICGRDKIKLNILKFELLIKYFWNLLFLKYVYRNMKVGRLVIVYIIMIIKNMMVNWFFVLFYVLCCCLWCLWICVRLVKFWEVILLDFMMLVLWMLFLLLDLLLVVFVFWLFDSFVVCDIVCDNLFCLYFL